MYAEAGFGNLHLVTHFLRSLVGTVLVLQQERWEHFWRGWKLPNLCARPIDVVSFVTSEEYSSHMKTR